MRNLRHSAIVLVLLSAAACNDQLTQVKPPTEEPTTKAPTAVGVYELRVTGLSGSEPSSSIVPAEPASTGVSRALVNAGAGVTFEQVSSSSFTDGTRTNGGQRYASFTYRVRNGTGAPLTNLTLLMVSNAITIAGTPISSLKKFDGTAANTAIASSIVPAGAVTQGSDFVTLLSPYPDVMQVFSEAEVAAITPPAGVTNIFPYGYVVRSARSTSDRTLSVTTDPNQWDGLMTVAFRLPQQSTGAQDVFSIGFQILAVTDGETRMTESIEESQDTAAVRRLRDRATALGATTVTVLNGSPAMDPAVPDYPGMRQLCSPRVAGAAGAPTNTIVSPGPYAGLIVLRPGENVDGCTAYFRTGAAGRPATNVPFSVSVKAVDRYGNVKTAEADTVHLVPLGPPASVSASAPLVSGSATQSITYSDYGTSTLSAIGRRLSGSVTIPVAGVTRSWTAGASTTDWNNAGNWSPAAVPMYLDSVYVAASAPLLPVLTSNVSIRGVTVEDVATISLGAFDLTAGANVSSGLTGGITNTSGRLFLAGIGFTAAGKVPVLRVTGTYSATFGTNTNIIARAPIQVDAGRLTVSGLRLQADSY